MGLVTKKELKKAKQALEKLSEAIALDDRMTNYKFDELIFIISLARTCLDYSLFLDNDRDIGYIYHDCSQSIFYYIKNSIMIEDVEANELLNQVDPLTAVFTAYATDPFFDPSQSKFYDLLSDNFSSLSVKIQKILTEINLKIEVDFLKPAISHSIWAKFHQNFVKTILNLFVDEILNSVVKTEFLTLCALNGIYSSVSER
ncbi:MAG: hypothetical protein LBT86_07545 [Deltaproteobacteria bacterium]|nr:hypothetical protein [Deltaproteobacteria bacterium]